MSISSVSPMPQTAALSRIAEARELPGKPDNDGDADDKAGAVKSATATGVGLVLDRTV